MRTLTKLLATAAVLTLSVGAFAHMQNTNGGFGYMHSMMDTDSPEYQTMLQMHNNPEAMQAWMQSMQDNPQAMQEWMEKIHGENFANGKGGFGPMHSMMDTDSPEYQTMLQMHNNPEAMQAWMQSMIDNPQAMQEWMEKVHGQNFANSKGGFGCHGASFNNSEAPTDGE